MAKVIMGKIDCKMVVITLGAHGLVVAFKQEFFQQVQVLELEAIKGICPLDSTGAGDCFIGYFVGSLMEYGTLQRVWNKEAVDQVLLTCLKMGIVASGISTQKKGTIVSYPDKNTVLDRIQSI